RAARSLRELLQEERGARIHLEKNIPMGAGLGGGSSDAAGALKGLLQLWRRRIGGPALQRLALQLGADVPFFLEGGLCSATGIGEKLKSQKPLQKTWMVLVYPGFRVSTKEAYAKVKLPFAHVRLRLQRFRNLPFPRPGGEGSRASAGPVSPQLARAHTLAL